MREFAGLLVIGFVVACSLLVVWRVLLKFALLACLALIFVGIVTVVSRVAALKGQG